MSRKRKAQLEKFTLILNFVQVVSKFINSIMYDGKDLLQKKFYTML